MKKNYFFILLLLWGLSQTKTFQGAWFEIRYPSSFSAKPSLKSSTSQDGFESAFFESPDKQVEFYVFSPQWNGTPTDITLKNNEKLTASQETKKADSNNDDIIEKWWTITANDGSYTRSYFQHSNTSLNTTHVFGIKYKNQKAYNRYKQYYLDFKKSLVQFAD